MSRSGFLLLRQTNVHRPTTALKRKGIGGISVSNADDRAQHVEVGRLQRSWARRFLYTCGVNNENVGLIDAGRSHAPGHAVHDESHRVTENGQCDSNLNRNEYSAGFPPVDRKTRRSVIHCATPPSIAEQVEPARRARSDIDLRQLWR